MFVYIEAQYLVKTVIFSAKLSRVERLPLLSSPRFVSPQATVRSASKSRSLLSLISIVSVSSSLLSFVIASSAYLDSQAYPLPLTPALRDSTTTGRFTWFHTDDPNRCIAVSTAVATFERIEFAENPSAMAGRSGRQNLETGMKRRMNRATHHAFHCTCAPYSRSDVDGWPREY